MASVRCVTDGRTPGETAIFQSAIRLLIEYTRNGDDKLTLQYLVSQEFFPEHRRNAPIC